MLIFWGLSSLLIASLLMSPMTVVGGLDDLGQHPARGRWMQKGHQRAADAGAWPLVDQPGARRRETSQGRHDVVDSVGHVMEPRAAPLEKARHSAVGAERGDQL